MQKPAQSHSTEYLKIGIVALGTVIMVLCVLLVQQYRYVYQLEHVSGRGPAWLVALHHQPQRLDASDVNNIKSWMTFDYINHLFDVPSQYLQSKLSITDSRYPRLTIVEYAERDGVSQATALVQVQDALRAHFVPPNQEQLQLPQ